MSQLSHIIYKLRKEGASMWQPKRRICCLSPDDHIDVTSEFCSIKDCSKIKLIIADGQRE